MTDRRNWLASYFLLTTIFVCSARAEEPRDASMPRRASSVKPDHAEDGREVLPMPRRIFEHPDGSRKEKMIVFDCENIVNMQTRRELSELYELEVVSLRPKDRKDKGLAADPIQAIKDAIKNDPDKPRLVLFACHGGTDKAGNLIIGTEKDKGPEDFEMKASDIYEALPSAMEGRPNPIAFLSTCHSGAVNKCVTDKPDGFAKNGTICASCSEKELTNPILFAFRLRSAREHCDEVDTDKDGRVSVKELKTWFQHPDSLAKDQKFFIQDIKNKPEFKDANKEQKELLENLFQLMAADLKKPHVLGASNDDSVVFYCPLPKK